MSDFEDELAAANDELNEEAGEAFTYDGVLYAKGLMNEPDEVVSILPAGEDTVDEVTLDARRTLFSVRPVPKKRLVYLGVTYACRDVYPVTGGLYRFKLYRP